MFRNQERQRMAYFRRHSSVEAIRQQSSADESAEPCVVQEEPPRNKRSRVYRLHFVVYVTPGEGNFAGKPMSEILDLLHDSEERRFAAGEVILQEGGMSGPLLFLAEGAVEVVKDGVQIATTSQPGTVFGVFSLLLNGRDAATIRALEPCVFRVIENPRDLLKESPLVCWHVCETITHRLATLTAYLCDVQRQFAGNDHLGMMSELIAALLHRQPPARIRPSESTIREGEVTD